MEEKNKNSKVKILIGIVVAILIIVVILVASKETKKAQIREEMKETVSNIFNSNINGNKNTEISDIGENFENKNEDDKTYIPVEIGQKVTIEDYLEYSFITSKFTKKLEPSKPDSYYTYYEAKSKDNTLLAVKTKIKNLQTEQFEGENLPKATIVYDGKYKYECNLIVEEDDGSDLEGYDWYMDIDPLKTKTFYYYIEIPKEIKEDTKSLTLRIDLQENSYELIIR